MDGCLIPINKRVLIVGEFGTLNGGENSLLAIAPKLIDAGWELSAAVPADSAFAVALAAANIQVRPWSVRNDDNSRKTAKQISSQLSEVITNTAPAILHFNSLSTSRIGGPIANELGIPSLGYLRDIMKLSKKAISDLNQVDRIVAVSEATRQFHISQGIDPHKSFTIHNGVDSDLFQPASTDNSISQPNENGIGVELGIPPHAPILMFVGQLGIRKGLDILIESFFKVASQTDAHLLIIGERHSQKEEAIDYHRNLVSKVDSSEYVDRVHWLGRRTDVAEIMRRSTLLIHPARQEPFGRVLLEAAASGLPFVTTNVGGSEEILFDRDDPRDQTDQEDSKNVQPYPRDSLMGLLVDLPNPTEIQSANRDDFNNQVRSRLASSISQRILELLQNRSHLAEVGKQLRHRAISALSIEKCATQIKSHYQELLEE